MHVAFWQILLVTVRFIVKDAEERKASFNPRPFFRLFINWLLDLGSIEPVTDGANLQVFVSFIYFFISLTSYSWLWCLMPVKNCIKFIEKAV